MPFTPLDSRIYASTWVDPQVGAVFSDAAQLRFLLRVEAALAQSQSKLGLIPEDAARQIVAATDSIALDLEVLRLGVENDGFPIVALVKQLREEVGGDAANFVHFGATTQDIIDSANILQAQEACTLIAHQLERLMSHLANLADQHRQTPMAGRTHTQHALPITFGLKVAAWLAPLLRHLERLRQMQNRVFVLQFGGAAGTLAPLGSHGLDVQTELAKNLGLAQPSMPWHTQRDAWAELASWLSMLTGSLGKMAQDVLLLAQTEIAELRESNDPNKGGSSTMPQKSNPILSEQILATARMNATLLAGVHHAMPQEHERGTHGLQMEWLSVPQMLGLCSGAVKNALALCENMTVNPERMLENVKASHGLMLAEACVFALSQHLPHNEAKTTVKNAVAESLATQRHLIEVLRQHTNAPLEWELLSEGKQLGSTQAFIDRVLAEVERMLHA